MHSCVNMQNLLSGFLVGVSPLEIIFKLKKLTPLMFDELAGRKVTLIACR